MWSVTSRPDMVRKLSATQAKLAADQREQIAGLLERIVPDREMPVGAGHVALGDQIAVGEKDRRFAFVGLDARGVDRHHVGPVEEIGNAAETFGLALCAIGGAGAVKSHELGVGRRIDHGLDLERERLVRRLRDGELVRRRHEGFGRQRLAVERERPELEFLAVEHQRRRRCSAVRLERSLERTVVAVGSSETSSSTVSINQSGGR